MRKLTKALLLVVWMGVIFMFSSQNGEESSGISNGILLTLMNVVPMENLSIESLSFFIRKAAHFTEYAILGLLAYINLGYKDKRHLVWSVLFCFIYAISDEIHQYFVPMRACSFIDVIIDTSGAIFALFICQWIRKHF